MGNGTKVQVHSEWRTARMVRVNIACVKAAMVGRSVGEEGRGGDGEGVNEEWVNEEWVNEEWVNEEWAGWVLGENDLVRGRRYGE
jgi:hypothetical protein